MHVCVRANVCGGCEGEVNLVKGGWALIAKGEKGNSYLSFSVFSSLISVTGLQLRLRYHSEEIQVLDWL